MRSAFLPIFLDIFICNSFNFVLYKCFYSILFLPVSMLVEKKIVQF